MSEDAASLFFSFFRVFFGLREIRSLHFAEMISSSSLETKKLRDFFLSCLYYISLTESGNFTVSSDHIFLT